MAASCRFNLDESTVLPSACWARHIENAVLKIQDLTPFACHGVRGDFPDYRGMARVPACARWRRSVYQAGALPYFEVPEAFNADFDSFLGAPE